MQTGTYKTQGHPKISPFNWQKTTHDAPLTSDREAGREGKFRRERSEAPLLRRGAAGYRAVSPHGSSRAGTSSPRQEHATALLFVAGQVFAKEHCIPGLHLLHLCQLHIINGKLHPLAPEVSNLIIQVSDCIDHRSGQG